jgi:hypothetical protein
MLEPLEERLLGVLEAAHDCALSAAKRIRISADPSNYYAGMLYFEIIELTGSITLLRRYTRVAGISIMMRSALDAFVDLKLLFKDPDYWKNLEAADSAEWRKILQAASVPTNDYLAAFRADPQFPDYRVHMKKKNAEAKTVSATRLGMEEKFVKAGMSSEYIGMYTVLSADVHNNTSHLKYRHAKFVDDEWVLQLYSNEGGYGGAVLLTLAEMLMQSSEEIHERYGGGKATVKGVRYVVEPAIEIVRHATTEGHVI